MLTLRAGPGFSSCTNSEHTLTNPMFLGTAGSGTLLLVDCEYGSQLGCPGNFVSLSQQ